VRWALGIFAVVMVLLGVELWRRARTLKDHDVNIRRAYFNAFMFVLIGGVALVAAITGSAIGATLLIIPALLLIEMAAAPLFGPRRRS
jgi:hypothetical protein